MQSFALSVQSVKILWQFFANALASWSWSIVLYVIKFFIWTCKDLISSLRVFWLSMRLTRNRSLCLARRLFAVVIVFAISVVDWIKVNRLLSSMNWTFWRNSSNILYISKQLSISDLIEISLLGTSSIYFSISTSSSMFLLCFVIPFFNSSICLNTPDLISCDFAFRTLSSSSLIFWCLLSKVSLMSLQFTIK